MVVSLSSSLSSRPYFRASISVITPSLVEGLENAPRAVLGWANTGCSFVDVLGSLTIKSMLPLTSRGTFKGGCMALGSVGAGLRQLKPV